jgi:alpha-amylase
MTIRRFWVLVLFSFSFVSLIGQNIMMQGWYWDYPKNGCGGYSGSSMAADLSGKASSLASSGFTMLWLPPLSKASFGDCSNGYDPKDLYDYGQYTGQTGFGTGAEVSSLISTLNSNGIVPVADVVYNHRDGGDWETNPAVRNYIINYPVSGCSGAATPYPVNGKVRYRLALGGSSSNGAGAYYFKFASASGSSGFNGRLYKLYFTTSLSSYNSTVINESEPNGGCDCSGQCGTSTQVSLGQDIHAAEETTSGCNTDEFYLQLNSGEFNSSGDYLDIYIEQRGGDGTEIDIRPYGIWSAPRSADIINELTLQTRTNFAGVASGQGAMTYLNFKPNGINATCMTGNEEYPYFFFDVEQAYEGTSGGSSTRSVYNAWNQWLWDLGIRGFRMDAVKHFPASFVGQLLTDLYNAGRNPPMVVGEHFTPDAGTLTSWINSVYSAMSSGASSAINVRAFDFELRQALKAVCDNGINDARDIFTKGIVDGAGASGYNAVTFINNHDFRSVSEHLLNRQMLAYAYILTNNRLGLPCIFYPDYYGVDIYGAGDPLDEQKSAIDALISVHKNYIAGATSVDYLNRHSTTYSSNYIQGGAYDALIYQIRGATAGKDVIVAINFENARLRVNHAINTTTAPFGTQFSLVAGSSNYNNPVVENAGGVNNSIYIDLPAYSYAVFLEGSVLPVELERFDARAIDNNKVLLNWTTQSEVAFSHYEIERSLYGNNFLSLGTQPASVSDAARKEYGFIDDKPAFNRPLYYRLKMVDKDGSYDLSPVRTVQLEGPWEKPVLFPNPTHDGVTVRFYSNQEGPASILVYDMMGRLHKERRFDIVQGENAIKLNSVELPIGTYNISLSVGNTNKWWTRGVKD